MLEIKYKSRKKRPEYISDSNILRVGQVVICSSNSFLDNRWDALYGHMSL